MLVEITLERKKRREFSWWGEILLFLNECSIGATKSGIEGLEIREKWRPRESTLCWNSVRGWGEGFTAEFWRRLENDRAERFELRRDENFLSRIVLWRADWNST